jgi:hypothetical protein
MGPDSSNGPIRLCNFGKATGHLSLAARPAELLAGAGHVDLIHTSFVVRRTRRAGTFSSKPSEHRC